MFSTLKDKYYKILNEIADTDRILSLSELSERIALETIVETTEAYRMQWIELFILLRADTEPKEPAVTNIRHTMELPVLNESMENRLIYGAAK